MACVGYVGMWVWAQLCEIDISGNFLFTWLALSLLGLLAIVASSAVVFKQYYWKPSFEQWQRYGPGSSMYVCACVCWLPAIWPGAGEERGEGVSGYGSPSTAPSHALPPGHRGTGAGQTAVPIT
jgi:hypothetical protein